VKIASLENAFANENAASRYAKFDFELWCNFFNVDVEAGNSIAASVRFAKERTGYNIN
jgi:hypothetical protein